MGQGAVLKAIRYTGAADGLLAHARNHLRDVDEGAWVKGPGISVSVCRKREQTCRKLAQNELHTAKDRTGPAGRQVRWGAPEKTEHPKHFRVRADTPG